MGRGAGLEPAKAWAHSIMQQVGSAKPNYKIGQKVVLRVNALPIELHKV
jgi:hypothetical protein